MDLERHAFAARHLYVYPRLRLAYSYIPKNACTAFKRLFGRAQGWLTADSPSVHQMKWRWWLHGIAAYPRATERIVVLRDPFDRLLSAYLSKFVMVTDQIAAQAVEAGLGRHLAPGATHDDVSFADFVGYLARTPNCDLDDHWRPQRDFLIGRYTKMIRFEQIAEETAFLRERGLVLRKARGHATSRIQSEIGGEWAERPAQRLRTLHARRGVLPAKENMYDDRLRSMIESRYAEDLDLVSRLGGGAD